MQAQADEEELGGLSAEALQALQEFAQEQGLLVGSAVAGQGEEDGEKDGEGAGDIRKRVQEAIAAREGDGREEFEVSFGEKGAADEISIHMIGVRADFGQTLSSTGVTLWRAARETARCMYEQRHRWLRKGARICELGAGMGLCSLLAAAVARQEGAEITVVCTDADELALNGVRENLALMENSEDDASAGAAHAVSVRKLRWGEHEAFLEEPAHRCGFSLVVAADVCYEPEFVAPLMQTAKALLLGATTQSEGNADADADADAENAVAGFLLGYAQRNVSLEFVQAAAEHEGLHVGNMPGFEPANPREPVLWCTLLPSS